MKFLMLTSWVGLVLWSATAVDAAVIWKTTQGTPTLRGIDVIEFAADGTLLLGDGKGAQIVAVKTDESSDAAQKSPPTKVDDIRARLGQRLGVKGDGIEILDMAAHPKSGRVFFAVRKQDDK